MAKHIGVCIVLFASICSLVVVPRVVCFGRKWSLTRHLANTNVHAVHLARKMVQQRISSAVGTDRTLPLSKDIGDGATPRYFAVKALAPFKGSVAFAVDRLESSVNYGKLSSRDRAFSRLLVTTVERRLGQIDAVLATCQTKPVSGINQRRHTTKADLFVKSVLRVGAAQLLFLNTSEHAAVKETVDVLRMSKDLKIAEPRLKYVNAVLRRLSREGPQLLANVTHVTANVAPWLVQEWLETWGEDATHRIIACAMEESPRCLTVRTTMPKTLSNDSDFSTAQSASVDRVCGLFDEAEILPQGSIRVIRAPPGPISTWPLYQEGAWWCQDPSATIPAWALYQSLRQTMNVRTAHVVDLCAAPGGKTAQLSNFGFGTVTAVEVSPKRCQRLEQNMNRLHMQWNIVVADGCEWTPSTRTLVDAVLVDVPCTATGTGSKRPDVLRRPADYSDLLTVQHALACHAADAIVKVGGYLVYATCSLLKQESEDQVARLLDRCTTTTDPSVAELRTVPFERGEIPGFDDAIDKNGWIRVLPGMLQGSLNHCDGFFVARLQRVR
jgi:16S rRNA (cytosine967-C5)-methyltransferase